MAYRPVGRLLRHVIHIVIHDYSGHPFQVQLSRELASRGHRVLHQFCPSYATGKGAVTRLPGDPAGFDVLPIPMGSEFARYSPLRRMAQELSFGARLGRDLARRAPDLVVLCNLPLLANLLVSLRCVFARLPYVFWHQDIYSHAIRVAARQRFGAGAGAVVGAVAERVERWVARRAAQVIAISPTFLPVLYSWGLDPSRVSVIPNWAAVHELPARPVENDWKTEQGLAGAHLVLYSGTLGLKHNPGALASLAGELEAANPDARMVVISEGQGREYLEREKARTGTSALVLLDYQPYQRLPDVLGSADVLIALLEPDASAYSVPSKVLTYLCAGRPIVALMPETNGAAQTIADAAAGVVVPPDSDSLAARTVVSMLSDPALRARMGESARAYAEREFAIASIGDKFEHIFRVAVETGPRGVRRHGR